MKRQRKRICAYLILVLIVFIANIEIVVAEITYIDTKDFAKDGAVKVTIMNNANSQGTFVLALMDSSGTFFHDIYAGKYTFAPYETDTITFPMGYDSSKSGTTQTAKIKVYDYNKPSNADEKEFSITLPNAKPVVISKSSTDVKWNEIATFTLIVKNEGTDGYIVLNIDPNLNYDYLIKSVEGGTESNYYEWKYFAKAGDIVTYIVKAQALRSNYEGNSALQFSLRGSSDNSRIAGIVNAKIYSDAQKSTPGFDVVLSLISLTTALSILRILKKNMMKELSYEF